jgi:cytochrome d ubiquinol oxidase subunit I
MDPLILARVQFAANISFHILFPAISIALAWVLLFFKLRYVRTREARWMDAYRLWVKIFALTFALGVVSGVTMSFQFGTNWPGFMEAVGNVAGPLLAYEVLTAFFLEATFLAIMLFGIGRVSERVHTLSIVLVAVGTSLSAFWILALNSWMQTPVGFEMIDGQAHATDWLAILFNPSLPWRLTHVLIASGLTVAFLVAGLSAWRLLRGDPRPDAKAGLRAGVWIAAVLTPLQIVVGDLHGLNTLEHQPAKIAAMEGVWDTERGAPLLLFAWPDEAQRRNHFEIGIPRGASWILRHDADGEIQGLNDFPDAHPPVKPVFFGFRVMVGVGILMLATSWLGLWWLRRGREPPRLWLRAMVAMTFSGWVATLAGWYVTEIGRQPWLVHGVLRTADAATPKAIPIGTSLTLYLLLYAALIAAYISVLFYLAGKGANQPPDERAVQSPPPGEPPGEPHGA